MRIRITKDCYCEHDMHEIMYYYRKGLIKKPMLKEGSEYIVTGEIYQNFYGKYFIVNTPDGEYHIDKQNVDIIDYDSVWVAVDSNGTEAKHYCYKPKRMFNTVARVDIPAYKTIGWWCSDEMPKTEQIGNTLYIKRYKREDLEPGTIEKLTGKKIEFCDEPIQIQ